MTNSAVAGHVYQRNVQASAQDSLSLIAGLLQAGQRVLDLGMGPGTLGRHLHAQGWPHTLDGVTINPAEADLARTWYRRVVVADLESVPLQDLCVGERYDRILCADVLEHLKAPWDLLQQCKASLVPGGRLILSVPNAAYCGLVAELMQGEFRYRMEGLLDHTHLRFFTHDSLRRCVDEAGWIVRTAHSVHLDLQASEFRLAFDSLPPQVAHYLLGGAHALTYQFVWELEPAASTASVGRPAVPSAEAPHRPWQTAQARFTSVLFLATADSETDEAQLLASASMGLEHQSLVFDVPASARGYRGLRLAPGDRVGFFRVYRMAVLAADGDVIWEWMAARDDLAVLENAATHDISIAAQGPVTPGALLVLRSATPWIVLPLDAPALHRVAQGGARVVLDVSWPMSADYLQASTRMAALENELASLRQRLRGLPQACAQTLLLPEPSASHCAVPYELRAAMVDIVVPVYRGLQETQRCLESVLAARCSVRWRLIVVNDASPEAPLVQCLRAWALRDPRIVLLENAVNLGFVASVNRAMALTENHDVLLLNSDTEVANDWLDRLWRAAYSAARVATVTPFSNNATLCSYPEFCQSNDLPDGYDTAALDRLFASQLGGQTLELPTGVGFCMYVRRDSLRELGPFDVARFGKGYGEENDYCQRAWAAGWQNLQALDVFVSHRGGVSFGAEKSEREAQALQTLRHLHPGYEDRVHTHINTDPARLARLVIDHARQSAAGVPTLLMVTHGRAGAVQRNIHDLMDALQGRASVWQLVPIPGGSELRFCGALGEVCIAFALPAQWDALLRVLHQLQLVHVHYHHVLGHVSEVTDLSRQLGLTHDFTVHDYYSLCPQITLTDEYGRYCGEEGADQCRLCLQRRPVMGANAIEVWREYHGRLLRRARHVFAPTPDAARRVARYWPDAPVRNWSLTPLPQDYLAGLPLQRREADPMG